MTKLLPLFCMMMLSQSPAVAWSTHWEEQNFKKACAIHVITMPWRLTIRAAKLIAREVLSAGYLIRVEYVPQEADYRAAIILGDR